MYKLYLKIAKDFAVVREEREYRVLFKVLPSRSTWIISLLSWLLYTISSYVVWSMRCDMHLEVSWQFMGIESICPLCGSGKELDSPGLTSILNSRVFFQAPMAPFLIFVQFLYVEDLYVSWMWFLPVENQTGRPVKSKCCYILTTAVDKFISELGVCMCFQFSFEYIIMSRRFSC